MNRMMYLERVCTVLLLVGFGGGGQIVFGNESNLPDRSAHSLVDGHLAQARRMATLVRNTNAAQPSEIEALASASKATQAMESLHAKAATAQKAWQQAAGREQVLLGLAPAVWTEALGLAADDSALKQRLQTGVSLDLTLALAALRNKEVAAAHLQWRAALNRFEQADYLQNLASQYRSFTREIDTQVGPQLNQDADDQSFALPSVRTLKAQLVDHDVELARLQYLEKLRAVLTATAKAYFETQFHAHAVGIRKNNRLLMIQMSESAEAQLSAGRVSQAEVLKAQVLLEMMDNGILQEIDHVLPHQVALLNGLLNMPPDTAWSSLVRVDLPRGLPTLAETLAAVRQGNRRLQQAEQEYHLMQTMLRMSEVMVLPRASQGYSRLNQFEGAEAGPTRSMEAAFPDQPMAATPMAELSSNLAWLNELRVRVKQAEAARDGTLSSVLGDARVKYHYAYLAAQTLQTYDSVTPKSKQVFDLLRSSYAAGKVSLAEFLDAGRAYFDSELAQEEARMELNMRWLDLESAQGRSINVRVLTRGGAVVLPMQTPAKARRVPQPLPDTQ